MELRKIQVRELESFVESEYYQQLAIKPIGSARAYSYLQNPQAQPYDFVLYFFEQDGEVLSFRTVFPARLNGENDRFIWLSGAWTSPKYRRQGLSRSLLEAVAADWHGRMMATNFSPVSGWLYQQTNLLKPFTELSGKRFYLFVKSGDLLKERNGNLFWLFPLIDLAFKIWSAWRVSRWKSQQKQRFEAARFNFPDQECLQLADQQQSSYLFHHGSESIKWRFAYPWLVEGEVVENRGYPFSWHVRQYELFVVKFYKHRQFAGFITCSLKDGQLNLLEFFGDESLHQSVAAFLMEEAVRQKVSHLTVLGGSIASCIENLKSPFAYSKAYSVPIFCSFEADQSRYRLQPAEGDSCFT